MRLVLLLIVISTLIFGTVSNKYDKTNLIKPKIVGRVTTNELAPDDVTKHNEKSINDIEHVIAPAQSKISFTEIMEYDPNRIDKMLNNVRDVLQESKSLVAPSSPDFVEIEDSLDRRRKGKKGRGKKNKGKKRRGSKGKGKRKYKGKKRKGKKRKGKKRKGKRKLKKLKKRMKKGKRKKRKLKKSIQKMKGKLKKGKKGKKEKRKLKSKLKKRKRKLKKVKGKINKRKRKSNKIKGDIDPLKHENVMAGVKSLNKCIDKCSQKDKSPSKCTAKCTRKAVNNDFGKKSKKSKVKKAKRKLKKALKKSKKLTKKMVKTNLKGKSKPALKKKLKKAVAKVAKNKRKLKDKESKPKSKFGKSSIIKNARLNLMKKQPIAVVGPFLTTYLKKSSQRHGLALIYPGVGIGSSLTVSSKKKSKKNLLVTLFTKQGMHDMSVAGIIEQTKPGVIDQIELLTIRPHSKKIAKLAFNVKMKQIHKQKDHFKQFLKQFHHISKLHKKKTSIKGKVKKSTSRLTALHNLGHRELWLRRALLEAKQLEKTSHLMLNHVQSAAKLSPKIQAAIRKRK